MNDLGKRTGRRRHRRSQRYRLWPLAEALGRAAASPSCWRMSKRAHSRAARAFARQLAASSCMRMSATSPMPRPWTSSRECVIARCGKVDSLDSTTPACLGQARPAVGQPARRLGCGPSASTSSASVIRACAPSLPRHAAAEDGPCGERRLPGRPDVRHRFSAPTSPPSMPLSACPKAWRSELGDGQIAHLACQSSARPCTVPHSRVGSQSASRVRSGIEVPRPTCSSRISRRLRRGAGQTDVRRPTLALSRDRSASSRTPS